MTNSLKVRLSIERDIPILRFIWRWKIAPLEVLKERFFSDNSRGTCFNRLNKLRLAGFVATVYVPQTKGFVWMLTKRGFGVVREWLPVGTEAGFKSECVYHDLLSLHLNLGDWVRDPSTDDYLCSEQELRRLPSEALDDWIPGKLSHRPDGYIRPPMFTESVTALEVELSPKPVNAYKDLGIAYLECRKVGRVLWLVPSHRMASALSQIFAGLDQRSRQLHQFILKDEFTSQRWKTVIREGSLSGSSVKQSIDLIGSGSAHSIIRSSY